MTPKPVFSEGIFTLRNLRSMGAAALVEILIALGLAAALVWHQLQPVTRPLPIVTPVISDIPAPTPPHRRSIPTPRPPDHQPISEVPPVPTDIPAPPTQPVQAPSPPSQPPDGVMNEFAASVRRAINAQKVYPKTSMLKGDTGAAVISFDYVDGVVSNIRVDKSAGFQALDDAAIEAVQRATLPPKPPELAGLNHFAVTLVFNIGG